MINSQVNEVFGIYSTKPNYTETYNGLAYYSELYMDSKKIGSIENDGNGGQTFIRISSFVTPEFIGKMVKYFEQLGYETNKADENDMLELFASHLLDYAEQGFLSDYNATKLKI